MTEQEKLEIKSYLLDRENPNYKITKKVMGVIKEFERCRKIIVDVAKTPDPHATIPVVIKIGDTEIHSKSMNDYEKFLKSISSEAIKEFAEETNEMITEIYNKHIFGNNDLQAEEKDAIINFSDDITYRFANLVKESGVMISD